MTATPSYVLSKSRRLARERLAQVKVEQGRRDKAKLVLEIATDPVDAEYRVKDQSVARLIGAELVRRYPGRGWMVEADVRNGIAKIYNGHVSGQFGWILKLKDMREASFSADIAKIGGEMLERSGLSCGKFSESEVINLQRTLTGQARVDLS